MNKLLGWETQTNNDATYNSLKKSVLHQKMPVNKFVCYSLCNLWLCSFYLKRKILTFEVYFSTCVKNCPIPCCFLSSDSSGGNL